MDATLAPGESLTVPVHQAGARAATAGFVDAAGGCSAAWGPTGADQAQIVGEVHALAQAARVTISFGGRAGTDLALACRDTSSLRAQYASIVHAYGVRRLDFDIEGAALTDSASRARRWAAVASLRGVAVTATLPVEPSGLTGPGLAVLRDAIAAHVRIATLDLLAMDFGDANAPHPGGRMAAFVTQAAASAAAQLRMLYPSGGGPGLSLTVMVGRNDIADEILTLADARAVVAYARQARLAQLSMWSLARDRACPAGTPPVAQPNCSGVAQAPYAFARILGAYRGP